MALFLDGAVIVILIITCIVGFVKGFVKYLVGMVSTIVAVALAIWGSNTLAEPVYERFFKEPAHNAVYNAVEEFDPAKLISDLLEEKELAGYLNNDEIKSAIDSEGELGPNIGNMLTEKGADSDTVNEAVEQINALFGAELPGQIRDKLDETGASKYVAEIEIPTDELKKLSSDLLDKNTDAAAEYICEKAVDPMVTSAVRTGLFMICFIAVSLVLKLIVFISGILNELPEVSAANRFGGLLLGAVKGILYCALIAFMLCTVVNATHDTLAAFNSKTAESTYLFRYFFDFFYR